MYIRNVGYVKGYVKGYVVTVICQDMFKPLQDSNVCISVYIFTDIIKYNYVWISLCALPSLSVNML